MKPGYFIFAAILILLIGPLALLFIYNSEPTKEAISEMYAKYVKDDVQLRDTVLDFTLQGDSLIMTFRGKPEIRKWKFSYRYFPDEAIRELGDKNQIIVTGDDVPSLTDTTDFTMLFMPMKDKVVYFAHNWSRPAQITFYNNKHGQLVAARPEHAYHTVDMHLYTEIEDRKLRNAVIGKINENFPATGGGTFYFPEDSLSWEGKVH